MSRFRKVSSNTLYNNSKWCTKKSVIKQINRDMPGGMSDGDPTVGTPNTPVYPHVILRAFVYPTPLFFP